MRTGAAPQNEADADDDYIISRTPTSHPADLPTPPTPSHQTPKTPVMNMQPVPASVMSPDEMLRAYATRKVASPSASPAPGAHLAFPPPTVNYNGNGMRTLYSPTTPSSSAPMMHHDPYAAYGGEDNEDAYGGTYH